ncbi:MAG: hypothetical protein KAJ58_02855 [Candidatus Pacebacteria bacterium]|nr:hypothetical protein [Candidatus Paceibacterota bacterium]
MKKILQIRNKVEYLFILGILSLSFNVDAGGVNVKLENPIGGTSTLAGFVTQILGVVKTIATPIAILAIIYSGFLFVKARGNPGELEKAKETLKWTLVGVAVLLAAELLSSVVEGTINSLK